jgi:hypothetical protein
MVSIAICIAALSLSATSGPHFVVEETELPPTCVFEFEYGDSLLACVKKLHQILPLQENGHPIPLKGCVDANAREVTAGNRTFTLDVIHVDAERQGAQAYKRYVVSSDGKTVDDFLEPLGTSDVWAFFGHGDDWVLETRTRVIVSGVDVASAYDVDEAAQYRIIGGHPLFVARKGNKYGLMTDRGPLEAEYDRVLYHECCEPAFLNPGCTGDKMSFFAVREGKPLYVEVEWHD